MRCFLALPLLALCLVAAGCTPQTDRGAARSRPQQDGSAGDDDGADAGGDESSGGGDDAADGAAPTPSAGGESAHRPPRAEAARPSSPADRTTANIGPGRAAGYDAPREPAPLPPAGEGIGPGMSGDKFDHLAENRFELAKDSPLSTFSVDVDTASYSKVRTYLLQSGSLPPADAVRIEELVNYFDYDYAPPEDEHPFAANVEVAECPWQPKHRLARIGIQGEQIDLDRLAAVNLVLLIDQSGSMRAANRLPLVKEGMRLLVEQLGPEDSVSIVAYAGTAQMWLEPTPGDDQATILAAIDRLEAGGSTAGGSGLELAYGAAREAFIEDGVNRVILCSDGDFNVGRTSTGELVRFVEEQAKEGIEITVLGFGMGNHNDAMMEQISNKGNGNYAFIDTELEARKVLIEQLHGTLMTIAKDVKIQVEFNPAEVAAYRLIGYENRRLAAEDFNDDRKDAGEIGAGHRVTALYEIIPAGAESDSLPDVDPLKYQAAPGPSEAAGSGELLTVKIRYKRPGAEESTLISFPVSDEGGRFSAASRDFQFAAAVASFGMLLRGSEHVGSSNYDAVLEIAAAAQGNDRHGYRGEFLEMVKHARRLAD